MAPYSSFGFLLRFALWNAMRAASEGNLRVRPALPLRDSFASAASAF